MAKKRRGEKRPAKAKRAARKPARSSKPAEPRTKPLLSLTRHGFSALRERVHAPAKGTDESKSAKDPERARDAELAKALERLEPDYDRVLKPK